MTDGRREVSDNNGGHVEVSGDTALIIQRLDFMEKSQDFKIQKLSEDVQEIKGSVKDLYDRTNFIKDRLHEVDKTQAVDKVESQETTKIREWTVKAVITAVVTLIVVSIGAAIGAAFSRG